MDLLNFITLHLGTSIAKGALKFWFKDNEIAQEISLGISEIINRKILDFITNRKTKRLSERITERVAEELETLIEVQAPGIAQNIAVEIVENLTKFIDSTKLSSEIISNNDLDPVKLEEYIRKNSSFVPKKFDENHQKIFNSLLRESCSYIIEIMSKLPSFYLNVSRELLVREDESIQLLNKIIDSMPKGRYSSNAAMEESYEDASFETDYLRKVATKLDYLELLGVSFYSLSSSYSLSVAYISLSLTSSSDFSDSDLFITGSRIENVLSEGERFTIRGEPGSGKTTLLKWISVTAARHEFDLSLYDWNGKIPFFIKMRSFPSGHFPNPEDFILPIANTIKAYMPRAWVHRYLENGKALILIDGIDEVPKKYRKKAEEWIEDLSSEFPDCIYIVTSRPPAIEDDWLLDSGFLNLELEPMSKEDISLFVDHWHKAASDLPTKKNEAFKNFTVLKKKLEVLLMESSSIRNLATNPLLCAMICSLNLDRKSKLPKNRMELYRIAIESLIERRDCERDVPSSLSIEISREEKETFLKDYAYWLIKNGLSDSSSDDFLDRIKKILKTIPTLNCKPSEIFELLLERSGILREPQKGTIDFLHRTFQEYLASKAAIEENDIGLLIDKCEQDQWREVIIMAAGHSSRTVCSKLINGILKKAKVATVGVKSKRKLYLLAINCREVSRQLTKNIITELKKIERELFPPKTQDEAKDLALCGEDGVDLLIKYQYHKSETKILLACIKSLTLINTKKALNALKLCATDLRPQVIKTLLNSWEYFNQNEYAESIFPLLDFSGPLLLDGKSSIQGVEYLSKLEKLQLTNCSDLKDITPIEKFKNLIELSIFRCPMIEDFDPISNLSELHRLEIVQCEGFFSTKPLKKLLNLEELVIQDCIGLNELSGLSDLSKLVSLKLKNCTQLSRIDTLRFNKKLKYLDLSGCYEIDDVFCLNGNINLTELNLDSCYGIKSLEFLHLPKLKTLTVPDLTLADTLSDSMREHIETI
jgi:hypothetical protein